VIDGSNIQTVSTPTSKNTSTQVHIFHIYKNSAHYIILVELIAKPDLVIHSHEQHNDVSVNDGPHIRRWSQNIIYIIIYIIIF